MFEARAIKRIYPGVRYEIAPPEVKTISAGATLTAYEKDKEAKLARVMIQNVGTGVIKVAYNQTAAAESYHHLLAADNATEQGLGSSIDILPEDGAVKVSLLAVADTKVCITKFYEQ